MTTPRSSTPAGPLLLSADNPAAISTASMLLRQGEVIALPTDTVYGVAASLQSPPAIHHLYEIKSRSTSKAIPILLSDEKEIERVAKIVPALMRQLAARFWPGALTLVLEAREGLPDHVTSPDETGQPTVAVRMPNHDLARQIIAAAGGTLAVTSANRSGEMEATDAQQVLALALAGLAAVVDGGAVSGGVPSTIVSLLGSRARILRAGAIPAAEIDAFLATLDPESEIAGGSAV